MIKMVIACTPSGGFAFEGNIPWANEPWFKDDLKHFKTKTMGCQVIMGRVTYDEIRRFNPKEFLPGRTSYVVTRGDLSDPQVTRIKTIWDVKWEDPTANIAVIGGQFIWQEALCRVDLIEMTLVTDPKFKCDKFIPMTYINDNFDIASAEKTDHPHVFHITLNRK